MHNKSITLIIMLKIDKTRRNVAMRRYWGEIKDPVYGYVYRPRKIIDKALNFLASVSNQTDWKPL
jgi:hypothetical protein